MQRITKGALAGVVATMAMTMAMRRLHLLLGDKRRHSVPPREIIDRMGASAGEKRARTTTLAAHFGFGALVEPRADRPSRITLGADKAYGPEDFVNELRFRNFASCNGAGQKWIGTASSLWRPCA